MSRSREILTTGARRRELEDAFAQIAECVTDSEQLVLGSRRFPARAPRRRRDARAYARSRSRALRLRWPPLRSPPLRSMSPRRSRLVVGTAIPPSRRHAPHRERSAHRRRPHVPFLRARRGTLESSPTASGFPSASAVPGISSTTLHQADEPVVTVALRRREADPAVAHHGPRSRHASPMGSGRDPR